MRVIALPFVQILKRALGYERSYAALGGAVIGYCLLKACVYLATAILLYRLLVGFVPGNAAVLGVALLFFHKFAIVYATTYHTTELQFATPVIVLYCARVLSERYSLRTNVFLSVLVGVLMLAKPNYSVYLAVGGVALYYGRVRQFTVSVVAHLFPLAAWLAYLRAEGIPYYSHDVVQYRAGV